MKLNQLIGSVTDSVGPLNKLDLLRGPIGRGSFATCLIDRGTCELIEDRNLKYCIYSYYLIAGLGRVSAGGWVGSM